MDEVEWASAPAARLADGAAPAVAFVDLIAAGATPRAAAIATCTACGTTREAAADRLHKYEDLWPVMEPGAEHRVSDRRTGYETSWPPFPAGRAAMPWAFSVVYGWPSLRRQSS